jgi:hypothetical protein
MTSIQAKILQYFKNQYCNKIIYHIHIKKMIIILNKYHL